MSANIEIEKNKFYRIFFVFVGGVGGGGWGVGVSRYREGISI